MPYEKPDTVSIDTNRKDPPWRKAVDVEITCPETKTVFKFWLVAPNNVEQFYIRDLFDQYSLTYLGNEAMGIYPQIPINFQGKKFSANLCQMVATIEVMQQVAIEKEGERYPPMGQLELFGMAFKYDEAFGLLSMKVTEIKKLAVEASGNLVGVGEGSQLLQPSGGTNPTQTSSPISPNLPTGSSDPPKEIKL